MAAWHVALPAVAVLFIAFLVWRMLPGRSTWSTMGGSRPPNPRPLAPEVKAARARARAATTPRARAEALCDAGTLASAPPARWIAAAGFFLRALHADPTWPDAVTRLVAALRRRRPRLLEKILWRRLANMPWDAAHRESCGAVAAGLRQLYEKERRDLVRAAVMRKLEESFRPQG
jgi:hypothetical protein